MLNQSYRKTKKQSIIKRVCEVYLRTDIACGYQNCLLCDKNTNILQQDQKNTIYILDTSILQEYLELFENCPILINVVILQISLQLIKNQQQINTLKNLIGNNQNKLDVETYRKIYIFPNEFSKDTYVQLQQFEKIEQRNQRAVIQTVQYYTKHLSNVNILFISSDQQQIDIALSKGLAAISIQNFIKNQCQEFPLLQDYLGIGNDHMEEESIFKEHLDEQDLIQKIKKGEIFMGKLNISSNNTNEAKIIIQKMGFEIKIIGALNLNRALNGDIVGVQLLPENQWIKASVLDLEEDEEVFQEYIKIEQNEQLQQLVSDIVKFDKSPCGQIVGILKRNPRKFCGHLIIEDFQQQIFEFICADSRYPNFQIKTANSSHLSNKKIMIKFQRWPSYSPLPFGNLVSIIGDIGVMDTESKVILLEHNVEFRPFSKQVLDCLPNENFQIPNIEFQKRKDLRDIPVCSVDPPGCKDIDDALHCIQLKNGNFEVGVHIADVSYYVKPDSAIDKEAAHRCTTVYLVDRRTDMLPKLLTEGLCSLRDDGDRLSFSCIWEISPNGEILKTEFFKSIIRSRKAMTYEMAQQLIDDKNDISQLAQSLRGLLFLAKIFKLSRNKHGALTLASTQVKFSFDQETHNPTDVSFYHSFETNYMVEEFMLLANVAVAQKINQHFPANSVLRRHTSPKPKQIKDFAKLLKQIGYDLKYDTNKQLAESLDQIIRQDDPFFNKLIRILTTRTMNEAVYFCSADIDFPEFTHYGLACALYTHFTSPIRRYADILVHRLLSASIDIESIPNNMIDKDNLTKMTDKMNMRNRMARNASRASSDYHQYLFFKGKQLRESGIIINISLTGVNILLQKYGFEGFVTFSDEDKQINQKYINQQIQDSKISESFIFQGKEYKIFQTILLDVTVELKSFHKKVKLIIVQ